MLRRLAWMMPFVLAMACGGDKNGVVGSGGPQADGGGTVDAGTADAGTDAGTPAGLIAIALSQTDVHIPAGASTAFAVTGTFADGTRADVTTQATATSSDTRIATVEVGPGSQIQIHALAQGTATVTVNVGELRQTCNVTVAPR